ncbi:MAG TPA: rhodanese [Rhodobacteraceae bacterium]|nr:rhodanese [Paracoccaceae bacterium]
MPQTITKGVKTLLAEANAQVETLPLARGLTLHDDPGHVFVDLRDIREIQRGGMIPGAFSCPRGMLEFWIDPDSPYHKEVFAQDKTFAFYCASAWRSALAAQEMGLAPVMHLEGGFNGWVKAGGPMAERPAKPG